MIAFPCFFRASNFALIRFDHARRSRRDLIASLVNRPSFRFAFRDRSRPSAVFGPVDAPPCSRQRVYLWVRLLHIAGAWQGPPLLVLAPHRGEDCGSPGAFPFRSLPLPLPFVKFSLSMGSDFRVSENRAHVNASVT